MIPPTPTLPSGQRLCSCFVYGTLMSREVVMGLIGRCPDMVPAFLCNHRRHPVKGVVYPGMISNDMTKDPQVSSDSYGVRGMLLTGMRPHELERFDWFEDEGNDYVRLDVNVRVEKGHRESDRVISPSEQIRFTNGDISINNSDWEEISTQAYIWARPISDLDTKSTWSYDNFRERNLAWYLSSTVKYCRQELDRSGIGLADFRPN
mmetsp:Transcript_38619/g.78902  ORF Transcript_38619/g.78902 Transcript_38619/m.78902 type:complete len:206 (-) Transcript_38619:372-989(-)